MVGWPCNSAGWGQVYLWPSEKKKLPEGGFFFFERGIQIMARKAHGWLISTDGRLKNTPTDVLTKKFPTHSMN